MLCKVVSLNSTSAISAYYVPKHKRERVDRATIDQEKSQKNKKTSMFIYMILQVYF